MPKIQRRTVLKITAGAIFSLVSRSAVAEIAQFPTTAVLTFTGIQPSTRQDLVASILYPFVAREIPVSIILDIDAWSGPVTDDTSSLRNYLWVLGAHPSNNVEIVPYLTDLAGAKPYFQGRLGSWARYSLNRALTPPSASSSWYLDPVSIATNLTDTQLNPFGLRVAGFRTLLQLPSKPGDTVVKPSDNGSLSISGGLLATLGADTGQSLPSVVRSVSSKKNVLLKYSIGILNKQTPEGLLLNSDMAFEAFRPSLQSGQLVFQNPAEFHLRSNLNYNRMVAIILEIDQNQKNIEMLAFAKRLEAVGIPFSTAAMVSTTNSSRGFGNGLPYCMTEKPKAGNACNIISRQDGESIQIAGAPVSANLSTDPGISPGFDWAGKLWIGMTHQIANKEDTARLFYTLGDFMDAVIIVSPEAIKSRPVQNSILDLLIGMDRKETNDIVDVPSFVANVAPYDAVIALRQNTIDSYPKTTPVKQGITTQDSREYLADARLAWSYILRETKKATGLCSATVLATPQGDIAYDKIAMWDIGSHIMGILSAYNIGIIEEDEFVARCLKIIANLPAIKINGLMLPSSLVSASTGRPARRSYNVSDVGRLLSALACILRSHPKLSGPVMDRVAAWDLDKTIRDGKLNSIRHGKFESFYMSHGAHYATRAFSAFGMTAMSPYLWNQQASVADRQMHLLYMAADIGILGPEPLLLEGLEMGLSEQSAYLANVLFSEQYRSYQKDGTYICPSEVAVERAPWFVYEGLDIGSADNRWSVEAVDNLRRYRTEEFQRKFSLVSSKGAYLWRALHPHAYSDALVKYVREKARIPDVGFASGIYVSNGKPTRNYSDLNTNGIILNAIASILGSRV